MRLGASLGRAAPIPVVQQKEGAVSHPWGWDGRGRFGVMEEAGAELSSARHLISAGIKDFYIHERLVHTGAVCTAALI